MLRGIKLKIKFISVLTLLFVILLTVGAVSASENMGPLTVNEEPMALSDNSVNSDSSQIIESVDDSIEREDTSIENEDSLSLISDSDGLQENEDDYEIEIEGIGEEVFYGKDVYYNATLPYPSDGYVSIFVNGEKVEETTDTYLYDKKISSNSIKLGTNTLQINYWGDSHYADKNKTISFEAVNVLISIPKYVSNAKDSMDLITVESKDDYGFIVLYLDGKEIFTKSMEKKAIIELPSLLPAGKHNCEFKYFGQVVPELSKKCDIDVEYKIGSYIEGGTFDTVFDLGSTILLSFTHTINATGNVTLKINGREYTKAMDPQSEYLPFFISDLSLGDNDFTFFYSGDSRLAAETYHSYSPIKTKAAIVCPALTHSDDPITNLTLILPDDANGNLIVKIDGVESGNIPIVDGKAIYKFSDSLIGVHLVEAYYEGTYEGISNFTKNLTFEPKITLPEPLIFGKSSDITIEFSEDFIGNISYDFNGLSYREDVSNPTKMVKIPIEVSDINDYRAGFFTFELADGTKFNSTKRYKMPTLLANEFIVANFNQGESSIILKLNGDIDEEMLLEFRSLDNFNAHYGGIISYYANMRNGILNFTIPSGEYDGLHNGLYQLHIIPKSFDKRGYVDFLANVSVIWKNPSPKIVITVNDLTRAISVSMDNGAKGAYLISIDGAHSFMPIKNKIFNLTNLKLGKHQIVIRYSGDFYFNEFIKSFTVTYKHGTVINAPTVKATYNVAKKLVVTLKQSANNKVLANKKITVKLGTISKTLTTNSKGQVSLYVHKLVPKTYSATIKFNGDSSFLAATFKAKVVVNKASPKIDASKKTFKRKAKVKKITAKLKNNKGQILKSTKISLTINKKTYTVKTNKKGIATFKVKLYKKGKFTGKIKFAGNKYYKSLIKKVKVTIK